MQRLRGVQPVLRLVEDPAQRAHSPNYRLIVEHETSSMDVLAVDLDGGERTLAVFSFAEDADTKVSVIIDKGSGDWPKEQTESRNTKRDG